MTGDGTGLHSPDKNVRIETAVAIGTGGDPGRIDELAAALAVEHDFFVRETLIWALVRMGGPAVGTLVGLVASGDPEVQVPAVQVLGKLGDAAAAPALVDALADADTAVRDRIVFSLGQIRDPGSLPALVTLLGRHHGESASTLVTAIESFGEQAFDVVLARLDDADAHVRGQVVDLLGFMGAPRCVAPLAGAAADPQPEVRLRALAALHTLVPEVADQLDETAGSAAAQAVRRAMDDPDRRVAVLAQRVLTSVGGASR